MSPLDSIINLTLFLVCNIAAISKLKHKDYTACIILLSLASILFMLHRILKFLEPLMKAHGTALVL